MQVQNVLNKVLDTLMRLLTPIIPHTMDELYSELAGEKKFAQLLSMPHREEVNEELLALVIDNYLSNAHKYTAGNCRIQVSLKKEKDGWSFVVFNEGASIAAEDTTEIWEIFAREDQARNREKGSSGMGLPISRQILELHGFKYGCESEREGVRFWFGK